jgi:hypothetical protein
MDDRHDRGDAATSAASPCCCSGGGRQPFGSIPRLMPAVVPVVALIVSSLGCGRRGSGAAVGIDPGSFACAYHGRDRHRFSRGRGSPGEGRPAWSRPRPAVRVQLGGVACPDLRARVHRSQPLGSICEPRPARMELWIDIASLPFVRGGAAPRSSLRRAVRVDDAAVAGADRALDRHVALVVRGEACAAGQPRGAQMVIAALRSTGSGAAVGADRAAFAGADRSVGAHLRLSFSAAGCRGDPGRCLRPRGG